MVTVPLVLVRKLLFVEERTSASPVDIAGHPQMIVLPLLSARQDT